jgi:hypothetical protein
MEEGNWKRSKKGNLYINVYGCNVMVFARGGCFMWRVENPRGEFVWAKRVWSTVSEAMADAWARK